MGAPARCLNTATNGLAGQPAARSVLGGVSRPEPDLLRVPVRGAGVLRADHARADRARRDRVDGRSELRHLPRKLSICGEACCGSLWRGPIDDDVGGGGHVPARGACETSHIAMIIHPHIIVLPRYIIN